MASPQFEARNRTLNTEQGGGGYCVSFNVSCIALSK